MEERPLPVMYTAFSLAGLTPVVFVAVTQNSNCALGSRSVTVQYVSFTLISNAGGDNMRAAIRHVAGTTELPGRAAYADLSEPA